MKKALAALSGSIAYLSFALPAFAQNAAGPNMDPCADKSGIRSKLCTFDPNNLGNVITNAVVTILIVATIIALFFLVVGGIRWITSGGDKAKVESARNTIIAAIVGLVIAFLAYFILSLVLGFFGIKLTDLKLPTLQGN